MNEYKVIKQHLAMDSDEFEFKDSKPLIPLVNKLLTDCGIEKILKDNIRLENPRFLTQIEKINEKKHDIKKSLVDYSKNTPSANRLRNIMHRTVILYDQTNQNVLEFLNSDVRSVD